MYEAPHQIAQNQTTRSQTMRDLPSSEKLQSFRTTHLSQLQGSRNPKDRHSTTVVN